MNQNVKNAAFVYEKKYYGNEHEYRHKDCLTLLSCELCGGFYDGCCDADLANATE